MWKLVRAELAYRLVCFHSIWHIALWIIVAYFILLFLGLPLSRLRNDYGMSGNDDRLAIFITLISTLIIMAVFVQLDLMWVELTEKRVRLISVLPLRIKQVAFARLLTPGLVNVILMTLVYLIFVCVEYVCSQRSAAEFEGFTITGYLQLFVWSFPVVYFLRLITEKQGLILIIFILMIYIIMHNIPLNSTFINIASIIVFCVVIRESYLRRRSYLK